jgi:acyl-CoA synthetase (AMP-forming)/AMP-acid ligase II
MVDSQLDDLRGVRQLLAGGDALSASHVRQTLAALPDCQLINGYGPTENTTFTCCHRFSAGEQIGATVPIGRPIAHTSVYVLDDNLELAPIGAVGELYTGGDGLARGYWQRPALTAEKFLPDPWSDQPGARLYRTGDLVRRRADGVIEFVGRRDNQIKLRGFRIELGEIESVLQQHPAVREAAVLAREDAQGVRRLVAYVVGAPRTENQEPRENREPGTGNKGTNEQGNNEPEPSALAQGAPLQPSALRQFLAQRLPEYMIPAAFVTLVALPISANGKIDRRALSARDLAADDPAQDAPPSTPPRTDLEHALAQIWSQVLGRERIGVHDNFFELGGHSLLATQIAARIGKSFQRAFQVRQIFEAPTVAQLAERLIAGESQPGQTERIAQMLRRLASLPPEERQKLRGRLRTKEGTA